ncbi:neurotrypsin isoform X2 [Cherax quadricarinatus]|uniref:neurotrypsin isoform X2 n=1 Tax=Cherax quadricarinatus TaxID=27406 RepID=UPI00387E8238
MSLSSRLILFVLLSLLVIHLSLSSPRRRGRGRVQEEEKVEDEEVKDEVEVEEEEEEEEDDDDDWGLLPGEVDAFRDVLINLMDIFDDGYGATSKRQRSKKCRGRGCRRGRARDQQLEEEEEEDEEPAVVIVVEDKQADPTHLTFASLLYQDEAPWGRCPRSCVARRFRSCKYRTLCGDRSLMEEAYCYVPGSACQDQVRTRGWSDFLSDNTGDGDVNNNEDDNVIDEEEHHEEQDEEEKVVKEEEHQHEERICGKKSIRTRDMLRILGGREARYGEWPWQVAVLNRLKETMCGGTVIAPQWVLTAAHCVEKRLYVRLAEHDLTVHDQHEMEIRVKHIFEYPDYDPETFEHDLALLKLPREVPYNKYIRSACLPGRATPPPARSKCVIAGWGKKNEAHIFGSDVLNYARVPIVTRSACQRSYPEFPISKNQICAGYIKGSSDTCSGDSGGPLMCEDEHKVWTVHGVTSFGEGCGIHGKYGVYTKVANYLPWIKQVIADN